MLKAELDVHDSRDAAKPLSSPQERLFLLDQMMPGLGAYNVPTLVRVQRNAGCGTRPPGRSSSSWPATRCCEPASSCLTACPCRR